MPNFVPRRLIVFVLDLNTCRFFATYFFCFFFSIFFCVHFYFSHLFYYYYNNYYIIIIIFFKIYLFLFVCLFTTSLTVNIIISNESFIKKPNPSPNSLIRYNQISQTLGTYIQQWPATTKHREHCKHNNNNSPFELKQFFFICFILIVAAAKLRGQSESPCDRGPAHRLVWTNWRMQELQDHSRSKLVASASPHIEGSQV